MLIYDIYCMANFVNVIYQFVLSIERKSSEAKKGGIFVKRRKTKRLLAKLLALVMVLSLCEITVGQSKPVKAAVGLQNPTTNGNGVTTWDCIYFGNYYQSNSSTKEPIKWRVLSVNGNDAFLLADQNLDAKPYNNKRANVTWATCTLRTWLNGTFLNMAFTSAEQEQ